MDSSISLKVVYVASNNQNLKVLGSCKNYRRRCIVPLVVSFVMMLFIGIMIGIADIAGGIGFSIPSIVILMFLIIYIKLPVNNVLYDEETREIVIYGIGGMFKWSKGVRVKVDEILNIAWKDESGGKKNNPTDGVRIGTHDKNYHIFVVDKPEEVFNNIEKVLPETFYLYEYVNKENMDKILSFEAEYFYRGALEVLHNRMINKNLSKDQFDIYIFLYFSCCLYNGSLNYFMLYFKKYLQNVIDMFDKIGLPEMSSEVSKLMYVYSNLEGVAYYENILEMYQDEDDVNALNSKYNEVGTALMSDALDYKHMKLLQKYILDNNIDMNEQNDF